MAETYEKIVSIKFQSDQAIRGIQQLNAAIEQNTKELKTLAKDGQKGTEEYARLEQQTKSLKKQKQDLSRVVQNEIKEQTQLEGSMKQMEAELRRLKQEYKSLSEAEREHGSRGIALRNQINQTTTALKKAEYGIQEYYRNVGNYKNAILGALGVNNSFVSSLVSMGTSGEDAGTALEGMGGDALRTTSAMATLNVHAKALGKTLLGLAKNPFFLAVAAFVGVGAAAKWFYDYNVEVEKATRLTREFTGVAGSELLHLRAEIQATASTYGKEYKEVLEGVNLLMSHFHQTSEQAIRTLNDGFVIGADINGNYLQLLKQYGPVFKDAGFSAEQLVALIQQTRSGIFSQQGLEAIKQAGARLREMTSSTRGSLEAIGINVDKLQKQMQSGDMVGAIQVVTDRLKTLNGNTQEYGNVMADVFGRQGKFSSQQMIESLGDIDTNLQHLKDSAGEYGKAMDDNQKATAALEEETAKLFNVGENGWETLKTRADTYWKQALTNAIKRTRDLIGRFAEMGRKSVVFRQAAQIIAGVVWQLTGGIIDAFRAVGAGFKAIGSWIDAFVTTFKSAFDVIRSLGAGAADILTGEFTRGINTITKGINGGFKNALNGLKVALKDTANVGRQAFASFGKGYNMEGQFFSQFQPYDDDNFSYSTDPEDIITDDTNKPTPPGKPTGSKGGRGRTSTPKKTTTQNTGKTDAEKEAERIAKERLKVAQKLVNDAEKLQKKADDELAKISRESIATIFQKRIDELNQQYDFVIKITKEQEAQLTDEEKKVLAEARTTYGVLLKGIEDERKKAYDNYDAQQAKERAERLKKANELAKTYADNMLATTKDGTKQWLDAYLKTLDIAQQEELRTFDANNQLKASNLTQWLETRNSIEAKYDQMRLDAQKTQTQYELDIQQKKYNAIATMVGGLGDVFSAFGEEQKEWLILQKTLAMGEIMIAQAVAIANAIKQASQGSITVWDMIAQIATGVTAVTTAMVQAFTALDSAKFATGGYVSGAGTGTSDSIPVRVSNGESIMNANTTAMFGGLLSSLNQLGGGVPIQVQQTASSVRGEDMLARAVARGVAMLPAPVVSVEDINRGQRQVQVLNDRATL